jgi:hypothetical protein
MKQPHRLGIRVPGSGRGIGGHAGLMASNETHGAVAPDHLTARDRIPPQ